MQLCTYSKSEVLVHSILPECPLNLSSTDAKKCQCRKRLYNQGPARDLRVLSCTFPNTWKGELIRNPQAFAMMIKVDQRTEKVREAAGENAEFQFTNEENEEPMSDQEKPENTEPTAETSLSSALGPAMHLPSLYDRIVDPLDFIGKLGTALFQSKMFGCNNSDQGKVLALACLTERKSPLELKRIYHIIGGNLTMRADAMLAEFEARGGAYSQVCRTADKAEIELKRGRKKAETYSFTWQEAQAEDYVYTSAANDGKIKRDHPAALKDNWKTPRRRMQMLWCRVISDAIRAYDPSVNSGRYTPEEFDEDGAIDVAFTPIPNGQPTMGTTGATAAPKPKQEPPAAPAAVPSTPKPPTQPTATAATSEPTIEATPEPMVAREQLLEMKRLKDALKIPDAGWLVVVDRVRKGAKSAKELTHAEGDRVLAWLNKTWKDRQSRDELSKWADKAMESKGSPQAEAAGEPVPFGQ